MVIVILDLIALGVPYGQRCVDHATGLRRHSHVHLRVPEEYTPWDQELGRHNELPMVTCGENRYVTTHYL